MQIKLIMCEEILRALILLICMKHEDNTAVGYYSTHGIEGPYDTSALLMKQSLVGGVLVL